MRPAFSFRKSDRDKSGYSHNNFNFFGIQIIACRIHNITLFEFIIAEMGCIIKKIRYIGSGVRVPNGSQLMYPFERFFRILKKIH